MHRMRKTRWIPQKKTKKRPSKNQQKNKPTEERPPCLIARPNDTLLQFATYAHTIVTPRMDLEKELPSSPQDLVPTDAEMLLSIAMLIEKINDCSKTIDDEHILTCALYMTLYND